ncbi:MAG: glycosyltransferase [Clostridia bacterium]|nr:glycosyltransferase [Clostridia bacterium]
MCVILSIIIPTYNCKKYIDECLISVLNNLPQNAEVIVVDDGSQDGTGELLSAYEHRHDIIKVLYSRHGGASHARNLGLDKAQGEFVMFLDCDDCLREGFWKESLPLLSTDADLFIFGIERIEMSGDHYIWSVENHVYPDVSLFADDYIRKRKLLIYSNCNKFYRRSIIEKLGLRFDEGSEFGEDRLFNYSFLSGCRKVITSSLVMLKYIQRSADSMSSRHIPGYFRNALELHRAKIGCFSALSQNTTYDERLDFAAYDLIREIENAVDRFELHPEEIEENLPDINRILFGETESISYENIPFDIILVAGSFNCEYRIRKAYEIGKSNSEVRYIVSGGNPHKRGDCTEAEYMAEYLLCRGVPESRIIVENQASNTEENLKYSAEIIRNIRKSDGQKDLLSARRIMFVAGAFHIPRVKLMIKKTNVFGEEKLCFIGAYGENTGSDNWYVSQYGREVVFSELKKRMKLDRCITDNI